ncbi:beta-glucosidase [Asticcacaulis benevestitus DSM 16100 = ATCC BAA-896]|uniref:Beta-glucosidase n=2 Tax=Asticcacaulis TaxID=76890 RepID=V4PRH5_9CAUL|nr:beta-glucosidase [Asticcacaulis benevestitus DSM 16100 = ATCC BAA-896]
MLAFVSSPALAQSQPWLDTSKSPEERAKAAVAAMTIDEKLTLIFGFTDADDLAKQADDIVPAAVKAVVKANQVPGSSGFVPAIPRLKIPAQAQTDASLGVRVEGMQRTALPSSLATAASFDPTVPEAGGRMIASEARLTGFNTFLAGGANLAREPRSGRNFEYVGEDPWLAGKMAAGLINGIQSQHMVSTLKHFAVNDQESQRHSLDVTISPEAMHQSDLLAFEFAYEQSSPGSVMCSYNLINGRWGCENEYLLQKTLKQDWGYKGYVMADWGAVHSTADAANYGLDQFTGFPCCGDRKPWFAPKVFKAAIDKGEISMTRLDDMATRILWPLFSTGAFDDPAKAGPIDFRSNAAVAQKAAEDSLVLLKNDGNLLPLVGVKSVAMIGGHADKGVLAGGGSSAVMPVGGNPVPEADPKVWPDPVIYMPSSPMAALKTELPKAKVSYSSGNDIAAAVALAKSSDVAIVFVTQFMGEGMDSTLELKGDQDALVAAVAAANPKTIVVIESGGAILMPWKDSVPAILEAFYPGIRGGHAIARILSGKVNPSGHLPISFPASDAHLAHADIPGFDQPDGKAVHVTYDEGATIGYKWYDVKGFKPLFAFGHGLSYTTFAVSDTKATVDNGALSVGATLRNTGKVPGKGVVQIYVAPDDYKAAGWEAPKRLVAFHKDLVAPGSAAAAFAQKVDPRLLATYEVADNSWRVKAGTYHVLFGQASDDLPISVDITLPDMIWSAVHN